MSGELTSLPEAKDKIFELLESQLPGVAGMDDVAIEWGLPSAPETVAMWTGESESDFVTIGPQPPPLNEDFRIQLLVEVILASGRDQRLAEQRMWAIAQAVGSIIRTSALFGPRCLFSRPAKIKHEFFSTDKRQGSRAFVTLAGTSRI